MQRFVAILPVLLLIAANAHAQRGVQWTPDGVSRLISKDVGAERWSISVDAEDGTVVGNVFRPDGGPPRFVWCWPQSTADDPVRLRCEGTTGCDAWTDLGEIELPASFFAPPTSCEGAGAVLADSTVAAGTPPGSALRLSPDERRTIISKDVGGQRWTMVYDPPRYGPVSRSRRARLSGNVFDPQGGPPQFVACSMEENLEGDLSLRCEGASACGCAPCAEAEWTPLPDVTLPPSFFEDRRCPGGDAPPGLIADLAPRSPEDARGFGATLALEGSTAAVAVSSDLYVFEQTTDGWQQTARLPAPSGQRFGRGVGIAAGVIAVGDDHRARLYQRDGETWRLGTTLSPSGIETGSVAAMADDILVLTSEDESGGSLLVSYERDGDAWRELERRTPPDDLSPRFFRAVAVSGNTLAATVLGAEEDGVYTSFVQLYERQGDAWVETTRLERPTVERHAPHELGHVLAFDGNILVVGAPPGEERATRAHSGVAYVYERQGGGWAETAALTSCDREVGRFGSSVAISGGLVAVAGSDFVGGGSAGVASVFRRDAQGWRATGRVALADAAPPLSRVAQRDLALDGATLLAGASGQARVFDLGSPGLAPPEPCPSAPELWPGDGWQVDPPAAHGMNPVLLDHAREYALQSGKNTQGVVVVRHGAIVAEWYGPGRDAQSFAASWSTAKSVASAVIGVALGAGELPGLDAAMVQFYPEWAGSDRAAMTLRQVLSMTSGLDWSESFVVDPSNSSDIARLAAAERDHLAYVLAKPLAHPPGTYHSYSSADTMLLSGVIESALGVGFADYARVALFDPIGMSRAEWWTDAAGHTLTYCCLDAPTREFARFGLLYARGGRWRDRQVIPEEYVRASLEPTVTRGPEGTATHAYGFQWWLPGWEMRSAADGFLAVGYDGQYIYVFPKLDLVIVRNGRYDKDPGPPIADPTLFERYPAAGLGNGRGTIPPESWEDTAFLDPILRSIIE